MKPNLIRDLIAILVTSAAIAGCSSASKSSTPAKPRDWTDVYNNSGKKVATFSKQKWIDYFSDFPGKGHGDVKKSHLPANSKLQFKYVLHQRAKNEKATLNIYSNKYASLKFHSHSETSNQNMPKVIWKLSPQTYHKVAIPQTFTK